MTKVEKTDDLTIQTQTYIDCLAKLVRDDASMKTTDSDKSTNKLIK
jgi:hypothetical protein